ncbi:peptidoglycan-binding protein [Yinghuangia sp. ASG 101]|uniref:peptidoglycan-binding protein n=1 Tax=Yinghuangia sp. ASG 101 TaxID=2896848 RepID=UPI001E405D1B|nr:peptidoglycan-binding protein [Yinghuangia sp. ASG 101]UGQ10340.1 peptidoglycan-binding protein [Yinghuangia sp. ASG 101]
MIAGFVAAGVTPATAHALDADQTLDDQGQPRQPADSRPHDHAQPLPEEERDDGLRAIPDSEDWQVAAGNPQGSPGPLRFGSSGGKTAAAPLSALRAPTKLATITRAQVLQRAQTWVNAGVPYSQTAYNGGYRQDCSGFVAMAWALGQNAWTGDLDTYSTKIAKSDLRPGDILLFHNAANPSSGSHVIIFEKWADSARTKYVGYEQTPPGTQHRTIPYAYFTYATSYTPYRYKNISDTGSTAAGAFPGAQYFGPGQSNAYITQLGEALVAKGYGGYYTKGPGPTWSAADQQATAAFQRAQGWTGANADGIPGPETWSRLMS